MSTTAAASSASATSDQNSRVSAYTFKRPDIPTDHVDPTAQVPRPPPGSASPSVSPSIEKFQDMPYSDWLANIAVVALLGLLAAGVIYRRRLR